MIDTLELGLDGRFWMCIPLFTGCQLAVWQCSASFQAHRTVNPLHLICLLYTPCMYVCICISLLYQVTITSPLSALRQNHRIGHLFLFSFSLFIFLYSFLFLFLFSRLFYLPVCSLYP